MRHRQLIFILLVLLLAALFIISNIYGAVSLPVAESLRAIFGQSAADSLSHIIVTESRVPMAVTALLSGAALSVAGLILQTTFQNPLAGPSILGVSSGASMGVSVIMLLGGTALAVAGPLQYASAIIGAIIGAAAVILMLLALSSMLRSSTMLLIAGIMIGYLTSAVISLLNFFAPAENVKSFVVWGLGSFGGVCLRELPLFSIVLGVALVGAMLLAKPLDALLMGERYAANMGYSIPKLRSLLLSVSGLLTAVVTAFCGPIGFLGLVVPHIARILFRTSSHHILLPASALTGAVIALFCSILTVVPGMTGVLPINAITPIIGVPVIIYILLNRRKLAYFN